MKSEIANCICNRKGADHCRLSPTCKGWGCKFLATPIDKLPTTEKEEAVLFSKVYREAKQKGVLECPFFNSLSIDRYLDTLRELKISQLVIKQKARLSRKTSDFVKFP